MSKQKIQERELIRQLSTQQGFIQRFFQVLPKYDSSALAYEVVESEHKKLFGRRRYSGWESFKGIKNRSLRQN